MSSRRVAQRRQLDGEDVEPVVEVLAQLAVAHRFGRIDVGGGDDADVDRLLLPSAEAAERALLQHAQQLDLRRRHHLGDLVEEQRAAVRQLEARRCRRSCAPVNAPFSWPKISLSSSVSGIAAQLIATNGNVARGLSSWIVCATSSLPVPDSPQISTDAAVGAACSMTR